MRARLVIVLVFLGAAWLMPAPASVAAPSHGLTLAGGGGGDTTSKTGQSGTSSDTTSKGQGSSSTQSGANKGQTAPATPEAGPPWTYQMARIILGLLLLLGLGIGLMYWRLVASRRRGIPA